MFQLSYTRTVDDFRQYQYLLHKHMQRTLWRAMLRAFAQPLIVLILVILSMAMSFQVERGRSDVLLFLLAGMGAGVVTAAALLMRASSNVELLRPNGPYTGHVQVTANDQGVSILLPLFRQEFDWAAVESLSNTDGSVILWLEPSLGEHIPSRAFSSPQQQAAFVDFVSARLPSEHHAHSLTQGTARRCDEFQVDLSNLQRRSWWKFW